MKTPAGAAIRLAILLMTPPSSLVGGVLDGIDVGSPPEWHFETELHADGSRSQHLVFQTVPGVSYRVETSSNLENWNSDPEDQWYGLGHEIVIPMVQTVAPPDPPDPPDPPAEPAPPVVHASLLMRPAASGGGLVLSWRSLDDGSPKAHHFPLLTLAAEWDGVPLFADGYGSHEFFITHPLTSIEPPAENSLHGAKDAAMLADFETYFPTMNQAVIDAEARARLNPPPAPPAEGIRKFWRIHADWGLDTDGDGSLDWFEHVALADYAAQAAAGNTPTGPQPDPTSADSNKNGIPDPMESDTDKDGVNDWEDPLAGEPLIDWRRNRPVRYSFHPLPVDPTLYGIGEGPFQIDGVGRVLFEQQVWSGGALLSLAGGTSVHARAMNEAGLIIGDHDEGMATWKDAWSQPAAIESSGFRAGSHYDLACGLLAYSGVLDDAGRVVAESWEDVREPGTTEPVWEYRGRDVWDLDENGGVSGRAATDETMSFTHAPDALWGPDASYTGSEYHGPEGGLSFPGRAFDRAAWMPAPSSRRMLCGAWDQGMLGDGAGGYIEAPAGLAGVRDFARETGVGIMRAQVVAEEGGSSFSGPGLWQNGDLRPVSALVSNLPVDWQDGMDLLDCSQSGAILAGRSSGSGPMTQAAVLLPVQVEDNELAAGVDDFSVACRRREAALGWQDRVWVMAPAGGTAYSNDTILYVPCDSLNAVHIETHGLGSLAPAPSGVTSSGETISWSSPGIITGDGHCTIKAGASQGTGEAFGVKAMKKRDVAVTVHWVTSRVTHSDGTQTFEPPSFTFTESQIAEKLDRVFGWQVNAWFAVTCNSAIVLEWDRAQAADYGITIPSALAAGDRSLDTGGTAEEAAQETLNPNTHLSIEQKYLSDPAPEFGGVEDPGADINVYIVGGAKNFSRVFATSEGLPHLEAMPALACSHRGERKAWMLGNADLSGLGSSVNPHAMRLHILAHEIGHILVGYGHPNEYSVDNPEKGGTAPLPLTPHSFRLMCGGGGTNYQDFGELLVKREWDEADGWLVEWIDSKQQQQ